ncbi:MAG: hypothetical protein ACI9NY_000028 [Kiritimatiellia bacterium]|jgi:hypothetical protein
MRKNDKKIDKQIIAALTSVCDSALKKCTGFEWLTHTVNYSRFPNSLKVHCVFDTNANLSAFMKNNQCDELTTLIQKELFGINIDIERHRITFDTEEKCQRDNNGNWAERISQ